MHEVSDIRAIVSSLYPSIVGGGLPHSCFGVVDTGGDGPTMSQYVNP